VNTDDIKNGITKIKEGIDLMSKGPMSYYLDQLLAARQALLTKYAPFKVDDRVVLTVAPKITDESAPGWLGCKHFLVEGARGIVKGSDVRTDGTLRFNVMFDDESYIRQHDSVIVPIEDKHLYCLKEEDLMHEILWDKIHETPCEPDFIACTIREKEEFLADRALRKSFTKHASHWVVQVEGNILGSVRHDTLDGAKKEAERVAKKETRPAEVVEIAPMTVARCVPGELKWEMQ
jgi:hypothetical protein